jgi:hypothetical protein
MTQYSSETTKREQTKATREDKRNQEGKKNQAALSTMLDGYIN